MVDFVATLGVVSSFVYKVFNMPFLHLGTYGSLVFMFFLLTLVGWVLKGIWGGDE